MPTIIRHRRPNRPPSSTPINTTVQEDFEDVEKKINAARGQGDAFLSFKNAEGKRESFDPNLIVGIVEA